MQSERVTKQGRVKCLYNDWQSLKKKWNFLAIAGHVSYFATENLEELICQVIYWAYSLHSDWNEQVLLLLLYNMFACRDVFSWETFVGISGCRAVLNRGSWLFSQIQIIKTIIWSKSTSRIRIDALNFKAMLLSFVIIIVNIVILDIYSCSASSFH